MHPSVRRSPMVHLSDAFCPVMIHARIHAYIHTCGIHIKVYLVILAVLVTILPAAVHVSVGGILFGCANGVFAWTILGPLVLISMSSAADMKQVTSNTVGQKFVYASMNACACKTA